MGPLSTPVVHNVKIHFRTVRPISMPVDVQSRALRRRNFFLLRQKPYCFSFFPKIGFVNVSGIAHFDHIGPAVFSFCRLLNARPLKNSVSIDCCTASGVLHPRAVMQINHHSSGTPVADTRDLLKDPQVVSPPSVCGSSGGGSTSSTSSSSSSSSSETIRLDLIAFKRFIESEANWGRKVSLSDRFPGAFVRHYQSNGQRESTVILFSTGKYIIVGARGPAHLTRIHRELCAIINLLT